MAAFFRLTKRSFPIFALVLCGAALILLYLRFCTLQVPAAPGTAASLMQSFAMLVTLLFLVFIGAALAIKKIIRADASPASLSLALILGFAILFRLPLLTQAPWLSNDIYRYIWDARVLDRGINPYLYPPEANELSELRDEEHYPKMSHRHVRTVYPPLLQGVFWVGVKSAQTFAINPIHAMKALFVVFDLLLIFVLIRILSQLHVDPRWVLLYAWHPLAVIEIASSGHTDVIGAFFLVAALLFLMRARHLWGTTFLALAFLVKFVSVLLLPFVLFFATSRANRKYNWPATIAFGAIIFVCYLPFLGAGKNLFSGLSVYSAKWRFNDAMFSLFFAPLQALIPDSMTALFMIPKGWQIIAETLLTRRIDLALLLTKTIMTIFFAYVYWRIFRSVTKEHAASGQVTWPRVTLAILAAFFLLSPTLQPWYLLWMLPVLVLLLGGAYNSHSSFDGQLPKRTSNAKDVRAKLSRLECFLSRRLTIYLWMLSGSVFLSYWVLYDYWQEGVWQEQTWVKWVEFGLPGLVFFLPAKYLRLKEAE